MASKDVTLYYFPSSFFSLKALLALYEKGVQFKHVLVDITSGEQNSEDYLTKNPNGEVPMLELGGEYISESEIIIDVIDHTFTSGPQLVPDMETELGLEVRDFRQMLDEIEIGIISFGVVANPSLQVEKPPIPSVFQMTRQTLKKRLDGAYSTLLEQKKKCKPELKSSLDRKILSNRRRVEACMNEYEVSRNLDRLENVFDKIEQQLLKSKKENQETWLFDTNFTAADITATILMFRLTLIGVGPRYFSRTTRPAVYDYYTRLMNRPSVKKVVDISSTAQRFILGKKLKSYGKTTLKVGLVIGLVVVGYCGFREYTKFHTGMAKA